LFFCSPLRLSLLLGLGALFLGLTLLRFAPLPVLLLTLSLGALLRFGLLAFAPLPFLLRQTALLFQTLLGCQLL
jgi:hypothetical protein